MIRSFLPASRLQLHDLYGAATAHMKNILPPKNYERDVCLDTNFVFSVS